MEFLWELFMDTGSPEVYLLYRRERDRILKPQRPAV